MSQSPNQRTDRELFLGALDQATPELRAAYLDGACGGNIDQRQRVEAMLAEHFATDSFMAEPALVLAPTVLGDDRPTEGPGTKIDRYKLLQQIGEGGMGVVYMAEQEEPVRRRVALKIIKLGMDTRAVVARFEAERQALALMDHPNIARVLDGGATEAGRPYFVMELVQGVPITQFCDQAKLPAQERLKLFIQVCQAVQSAHQKGIIHRDLKPSNILVTLHHGEPMPKVIDFGIAKATNQKLTEKTLFTNHATMIGTPAYMSPEQAELTSMDVDTRTDVYSLGVLLYELLTGSTPFPEKRLRSLGYGEMQRVIVDEEPERPSTRLSTLAGEQKMVVAKNRGEELAALSKLLRGDLDWVVMRCLEKDRRRRYETANGLAADIQRHLNNEPVVARPPSQLYRFQKAYRRNRLAFSAVACVLVSLIIALVFIWTAARREGRARVRESIQRNLAEQQRQEAQSAQKTAETEQRRADVQARKASESQQQSHRLLYAADMNLAQQALKQNNLGRARRLLDRHRPAVDPKSQISNLESSEDLRGWEWRYLWQLTRSGALVTLTNRPVRGFSVSFSPDGGLLAVGWEDGQVDLWDVPGRRLVRALTTREYPYPHFGRVAFSPVRNLLATTSEPKVVTVYDLDSGRESELWRAPDQGEWNVRDLSFSQDGSRVVIYGGSTPEIGDAAWVVNVSSSQIENRHPAVYSRNEFWGAARLSPDNRRLYLQRSDSSNNRYSIQCLDLTTGKELWRTDPQRDQGLTTLAISPDGRTLASGSGFVDPTIRVWDAATGRLLTSRDGHTGWVSKLAFTKDGRRLISAASDQSIRFWDTSNWTETRVLRGHTDEVQAVAISATAQLIASVGKDGNLILWRDDGKGTADGYSRLPENLRANEVMPLDHSRVLLLPGNMPPELVDLKRDPTPVPLPEIATSTNVLGCFGTNILCHWNGTNQILVREWRGAEFILRGAITLESGKRPTGFAYHPKRQLLVWSEGSSPASVHLASLAAPSRRMELKGDVPELVSFRFNEDGTYLAASAEDSLRVWNVETGQIVASIKDPVVDATFAAGGRVLVVAVGRGNDHEIGFYDLAHSDREHQRVRGKFGTYPLAVSPDGGLVASSTAGGLVRLFDPAKGEWLEDLQGHLNGVLGIAFSPDGRRLISASTGREAVKLWNVGTRQELLSLSGADSTLTAARWSADGDVILAGPPWQAWRAPSWEEIAAAEAKEKADSRQP